MIGQPKSLRSQLLFPMPPEPQGGLIAGVPVFNSVRPGDLTKSRVPVFEDKQRVAHAINTLIEFGFVLGCDGELLPPRWLRRPARPGGRVG